MKPEAEKVKMKGMKDDMMKSPQETDRISTKPENPYANSEYFGTKGKTSGFRANQPMGRAEDNTRDGNGGHFSKG